MSVLLANTVLGVRRRGPVTRDALGDELPGLAGPLLGPWPGRAAERGDGRWALGVDPLAWPVRQHDLVEDATGRTWVVTTAQLLQNSYDPSVDWVRIEGLEQVPVGGTEPGGPEFVGRS